MPDKQGELPGGGSPGLRKEEILSSPLPGSCAWARTPESTPSLCAVKEIFKQNYVKICDKIFCAEEVL